MDRSERLPVASVASELSAIHHAGPAHGPAADPIGKTINVDATAANASKNPAADAIPGIATEVADAGNNAADLGAGNGTAAKTAGKHDDKTGNAGTSDAAAPGIDP